MAAINFQQLHKFVVPDDGVTWVDRTGTDGARRVVAAYVEPDSPAERAEIHVGDEVVRRAGVPDWARHRCGAHSRSNSELQPPSADNLHAPPAAVSNSISSMYTWIKPSADSAVYYQYGVGLAWLFIGLFVYYRRTNAPKALHFFLLCLFSFVASCFHYSGKAEQFRPGRLLGQTSFQA